MKKFAIVSILGLMALSSSVVRAEEPKDGLSTEAEAGIVVTGGNASTQSYNFKDASSYLFTGNLFKLSGHYLSTTTSGVESARNWDLSLRYERTLFDGLAAYVGQGIEADTFGGYTQRYNTDVGGKYKLIQDKDLVWSVEAGYRLSIENELAGTNKTSHFLRAYTEVTKNWTESFSIKYWLEVLPNLTDTSAYRINTELSGIATLSSIFSLKVGYGLKFNNVPPSGAVYKTDSVFTTALVAKLTPDSK